MPQPLLQNAHWRKLGNLLKMYNWKRCFGGPMGPQHRPPTWKEMGFGRRVTVGALILIIIGGACLVWGLEELERLAEKVNKTQGPLTPIQNPPLNRTKRQTRTRTTPSPKPRCGARLVLEYIEGTTTAFTFDLCQAIDCGGRNSSSPRERCISL